MFRKTVVAALATAAVAFAAVTPASAGDYQGDFMIRAGVSVVAPDSSADVFFGGVQVPGADAEVSTQWIPSATLTYFLTDNIAADLFCCFSTHDVEGRGALAGADLGDTWIFPPIVTLQYHFTGLGGIKPYVGAGVQYIHFFDEGTSPTLGGAQLDIDDAWGFVLQAGFDVEMGGGWYMNADVKKSFIDLDASWQGTGVTAEVELNPWIISAGIGYRFNRFGPSHGPLK